jgi:3-hydroxyacyl-CoA dehydrogenase/enoyl-CoA hydratase/3-hydroxybutyryl-CoA epimerase
MNDTSTSGYADWQVESDADGIVWLALDKAEGSANVLSRPVLEQLADILGTLESSLPSGVVVHSAKSSGFVMGADINEFTTIDSADAAAGLVRAGQEIMNRLEALPCPSVAVINGFALGGGLELAMACDYRVALAGERRILGLPEVQLGLHPGFGGTVRAVRLCGVRFAMQLMLTGQPVTVAKGLRHGLIDRVVADDDWKPAAREVLATQPARASAPLLDRVLGISPLRPVVARTLRKQVAKKARPDHYPAPYAIIDLWRQHGGAGADAYAREAASFAHLLVGSTARNLVRVFFLQNRLKSQGKKAADPVRRVHVVGAGVMGGDIAAWCALRGMDVTLQDRAEEFIRPALERAGKLFGKKLRDQDKRDAARERLKSDPDGTGVAAADLVVEAIFENLEAKQSLYEDLQERMKDDAILATNTSSIRLEDLRTGLDQPQRFIGLHFFNPVALLPLVEIVRCDDTEQAVLDRASAFVRAIGKLPLGCTSSPGFVVNRVLGPYMAEAMHLIEDGADLAAIDRVAEDFGMPMGPVELLDSVGIDVAMHVSQVLGGAFDRPIPSVLSDLVDKGRLGRKTGQGFYAWEDGKAVKKAPQPSSLPGNASDRLMLPMVNEAVACLSENVVEDADLLDAGVIFGTGFAPFRGGPLQYARERGKDQVVAALQELATEHGERFRPHSGWSNIV